MPCKSSLLISYLETYVSRPEHWLRDKIAINVSKEHHGALCCDYKTHPKALTTPVFAESQYGDLKQHGIFG
jgi:hypothetical protein